MAMSPVDFAAKLVELREAHLLSKEGAARKIGMSERHYVRWEGG